MGISGKKPNNGVYSAVRRPYIWLLVISILLAVVASLPAFVPDLALISSMRPDIGALAIGIFSSYLTAVFVDGTFRAKEKRDRQRLQNTALTELQRPLNSYLKLLRIWYRCSLKDIPEQPPQSLRSVIETDEIESVRLLNFGETYPIHQGPATYTFLTHSAHQIEQIQSNLDEVLQKYSHFMDPELLESVQEFRNSKLFNTMVSFSELGGSSQGEIVPIFAADGYLLLQENLDALIGVVDYYESPSAPELSLMDISYMWHDDENPKIGSARINASLDQIREIELSDEPPYQFLGDEIWDVIEEYEKE